MKKIIFTQRDFTKIKDKNLQIRHLISDILPYLEGNELKTFQKFFKYSENLEKRMYIWN